MLHTDSHRLRFFLLLDVGPWASKMAQQLKVLATKPSDLS